MEFWNISFFQEIMNYQVDEEERGGPDGDPFGGMPVHVGKFVFFLNFIF